MIRTAFHPPVLFPDHLCIFTSCPPFCLATPITLVFFQFTFSSDLLSTSLITPIDYSAESAINTMSSAKRCTSTSPVDSLTPLRIPLGNNDRHMSDSESQGNPQEDFGLVQDKEEEDGFMDPKCVSHGPLIPAECNDPHLALQLFTSNFETRWANRGRRSCLTCKLDERAILLRTT